MAGFDLMAGLELVFGPGVAFWAMVVAANCQFNFWFHWKFRADPHQVTIKFKNWSIAGGLLILASEAPGRIA